MVARQVRVADGPPAHFGRRSACPTICFRLTQPPEACVRLHSAVMLSEALQRNAKHEARLSNISVVFCRTDNPEIESVASRTSSPALQLRSAQNDK